MTLDEYFEGYEESRRLFEIINSVIQDVGLAELRVTKSQVAFWRKRAFAWVWIPDKYLHRKSAPLVLTLGFRYRDPSPRWKEIVEAKPGQFTHHLELYSVDEIDAEICDWLREAWQQAL